MKKLVKWLELERDMIVLDNDSSKRNLLRKRELLRRGLVIETLEMVDTKRREAKEARMSDGRDMSSPFERAKSNGLSYDAHISDEIVSGIFPNRNFLLFI